MEQEKGQKLLAHLQQLESVVVGFSGGVDSSFLAAAAYRALGDQAVAVTAVSETLAEEEKLAARETAAAIGIAHQELWISELADAGFAANSGDRCYHCKRTRFGALREWAREHGFRWVLDGANVDDLSDYRPGMQAIKELDGVCSPLLENGLTKADIRELSRQWGVPTWNKLSMPCLSSRIAYGQQITAAGLRQVEEAEAIVRQHLAGPVRVRHHGDLARIEVNSAAITTIVSDGLADELHTKLRGLGFRYVTLDLGGYRTGSLNEQLDSQTGRQGNE